MTLSFNNQTRDAWPFRYPVLNNSKIKENLRTSANVNQGIPLLISVLQAQANKSLILTQWIHNRSRR